MAKRKRSELSEASAAPVFSPRSVESSGDRRVMYDVELGETHVVVTVTAEITPSASSPATAVATGVDYTGLGTSTPHYSSRERRRADLEAFVADLLSCVPTAPCETFLQAPDGRRETDAPHVWRFVANVVVVNDGARVRDAASYGLYVAFRDLKLPASCVRGLEENAPFQAEGEEAPCGVLVPLARTSVNVEEGCSDEYVVMNHENTVLCACASGERVLTELIEASTRENPNVRCA